MSTPSSWPLPPESIRFVLPQRIIRQLEEHPLSSGLYPLGAGYYKKAADHQMSRTEHDDQLLIYCLEGEGRMSLDKQTIRVKSGDILLLPRGTAHKYQALSKDPWTIYWVHFDGHHADDFMQHLLPGGNSISSFKISLGYHSRLVSDFETLLETRRASYNLNAYLFAANQLRQILSHIAVLGPLARQRAAGESLDLEKIHSLMQSHVHEQLDLETLAEASNLSKYHFVKKYKELTGTTPINHFIHLKIERACHLLDASSQSIGEIAFAVGYEDAYYFSRIFKKMMGVSPSQYRNMRLGTYPYKPR